MKIDKTEEDLAQEKARVSFYLLSALSGCMITEI